MTETILCVRGMSNWRRSSGGSMSPTQQLWMPSSCAWSIMWVAAIEVSTMPKSMTSGLREARVMS